MCEVYRPLATLVVGVCSCAVIRALSRRVGALQIAVILLIIIIIIKEAIAYKTLVAGVGSLSLVCAVCR